MVTLSKIQLWLTGMSDLHLHMSTMQENPSNRSDKFDACYFVLSDHNQFSATLIILAESNV